MMPTNVAARMTLAADPGALQAAVAAGILGAGPVVLGTSEECARLLEDGQRRVAEGVAPVSVANDVARSARASAAKVPGFGHPVHTPVDPRAERILVLADERSVSGPHVELARALGDAVAEEWGRPLPMNVAMPIAAVHARPRLLHCGREGRSDPRPHGGAARAPGRGAGESARLPDGREGGGSDRLRATAARLMLEPEVESRSMGRAACARRRELPLAARLPLRALRVLPTQVRRSRARVGERRRGARGHRRAAAHREERAQGDDDVGEADRHACARRRTEIVRIFSTSGTTGAPSYIPLTRRRPRRLGHWLGAKLCRVGGRGWRANRLDVQRRPVRRRRCARVVRSDRALPYPDGHGQHRAPAACDSRCCGRRPRCSRRRMPPICSNAAAERGVDLRESSVARCSSRVSRVAASRRSGRGSRRAGAPKVTEAMGIGDIGVSLWGECEEQDGMHLGARGFVHRRADRSRLGRVAPAWPTGPRASSC